MTYVLSHIFPQRALNPPITEQLAPHGLAIFARLVRIEIAFPFASDIFISLTLRYLTSTLITVMVRPGSNILLFLERGHGGVPHIDTCAARHQSSLLSHSMSSY